MIDTATMATCRMTNETANDIVFYYNMPPDKVIHEHVLKPNESRDISVGTVKYLVGIKIDDEIMVPRAFYTSVHVTLTKNGGKYYYHYDFNENEPSDDIPEDLIIWFCHWVADLYQNNEISSDDATILSKKFIDESYPQIPADYFAKCCTIFQGDVSDYENIKQAHLASLRNYRHEVKSMTSFKVI